VLKRCSKRCLRGIHEGPQKVEKLEEEKVTKGE
jgi:hypothetical protein